MELDALEVTYCRRMRRQVHVEHVGLDGRAEADSIEVDEPRRDANGTTGGPARWRTS
jgi:hypothetical protein